MSWGQLEPHELIADDYCAASGMDKVDPDDKSTLEAFLAWIEETGRSGFWDFNANSLQVAHAALHGITESWPACELAECLTHGTDTTEDDCEQCIAEFEHPIDRLDHIYTSIPPAPWDVPDGPRRPHLRLIRGGDV